MNKLFIIIIILLLSFELFASQGDSLLYAINKKTGKETPIRASKYNIFTSNNNKKVTSFYAIKNDSTIVLKNNTYLKVSDIKTIQNEDKNKSNIAFVYSLISLITSGLIANFALFIRYFEIKLQNQTTPTNSGEWVLIFLLPIVFITIISVVSFIYGFFYSIKSKSYSSENYNFIIK